MRGVHSAEEALEIALEHDLEVVISDIRMPGQGGLELLSRLKVERPEIQVIIMTAYGTRRLQRQALGLGAFHYLEKPVRTRELIEQVRRCLQLNASQRKSGVRGALYRLQLRDIIQLYCTANETVEILVRAPGKPEGRIFLEAGQIVHAVDGKGGGEDALHRMLASRTSDIGTRPLIRIPGRTIERDWMHLLLEHARRQDEYQHDTGLTSSPFESAIQAAPQDTEPLWDPAVSEEPLELFEVDDQEAFPTLGSAIDLADNPFAALDEWDETHSSHGDEDDPLLEVADLIEQAVSAMLEGRGEETLKLLDLARTRCLEGRD